MPIKGRVQSQAIKAALAAMPDAVRARHGEAIRVTLSEMKRIARATVKVETGTLQDHIDFSFSPTYARGKFGISPGSVWVQGRTAIGATMAADIGASRLRSQGARLMRASHYAHLVEFGSPQHPMGAPFMGPAFSNQLSPLQDRMRVAQRDVVEDLTHIGSRYL